MRNSLDYSIRALAIAPGQVHFKFNIAFVQIQIAQLMHSLPESQRTLAEVQAASEGLDAAIESFTQIAHSKNPPYPKHDIEQRANMGRNTMRHQLERAVQSQRKYEEKNAAKLQDARDSREAELRKRQEERRIVAEAAEEEKRKIAEERHKMLQISRELAEQRAETERRKEEAEYTEDEETGERVKRKKIKKGGKRKKKGDDSGTDGEGDTGRRGKSTEDESGLVSGEETARPVKRRRKLAKKGHGGRSDHFKSSEIVVDSDSDGKDIARDPETNGNANANGAGDDEDEDGDTKMNEPPLKNDDNEDDDEDEEEDEEEQAVAQPRKPISRRIQDDDDDEDEDEDEDVVVEDKNESNPTSSSKPSTDPNTQNPNTHLSDNNHLSSDDDDEDPTATATAALAFANAAAAASAAASTDPSRPKGNVFSDPPDDLQMTDASVMAAGDSDREEY